jgi:hypothetical protein
VRGLLPVCCGSGLPAGWEAAWFLDVMVARQGLSQSHRICREGRTVAAKAGGFSMVSVCARVSLTRAFAGNNNTQLILNSAFTILHSPALRHAAPTLMSST